MAKLIPHCLTTLILGAVPGGGKGTLTRKLTEAGFEIHTLPFREVLDEMVLEKDEWRRVIEPAREAGVLITFDIMKIAIPRAFDRFVPDPEKVLVLDGCPRVRRQIDPALSGLESKGYKRKLFLHLECSPVLAAARMARRARDEADRDPMRIFERMCEFEDETAPVIRLVKEHHPSLGLEFKHFHSNNLDDDFDALKRVLNL